MKKGKLILSIVNISVAFIIFVVIMCVYIEKGYSWFAFNKDVDGNGLNVDLKGDDFTITEVHIYPVTEINGNNYTFEEAVENYDFAIPCEDPADIIQSIYKKAIILSFDTVINSGVTVTLTAECSQPWIDNTSMANCVDRTIAEKQNYLSNCVRLYTGTVQNGVFTKSNQPVKFANGDPTGTITKSSANLSSYTTATQDFYILMEYDPTLIQYFTSGANISYESVTYANDITFKLSQGE